MWVNGASSAVIRGVFRPIRRVHNLYTTGLWKTREAGTLCAGGTKVPPYLNESIRLLTCLSKSPLFFRISSTFLME